MNTFVVVANTVGKRIRQLRRSKKMSYRVLAKKSNTSPSTLSRVEKGETSPTIDLVSQIATGLDVSIIYLLFDDSDEHLQVEVKNMLKKAQYDTFDNW